MSSLQLHKSRNPIHAGHRLATGCVDAIASAYKKNDLPRAQQVARDYMAAKHWDTLTDTKRNEKILLLQQIAFERGAKPHCFSRRSHHQVEGETLSTYLAGLFPQAGIPGGPPPSDVSLALRRAKSPRDVVKVLREHHAYSLRYLDLSGLPDKSCSVEQLRALCRELLTAPHLTTLSLAGFPLGPEGAAVVAELAQYGRLTCLDVSGTQLGDPGLRAIVDGLPGSTLQTLVAKGNGISDAGAADLARRLPTTAVQALYLEHNQVGERGATALVQALGQPGLVDLTGNPHDAGLVLQPALDSEAVPRSASLQDAATLVQRALAQAIVEGRPEVMWIHMASAEHLRLLGDNIAAVHQAGARLTEGLSLQPDDSGGGVLACVLEQQSGITQEVRLRLLPGEDRWLVSL